jgi:hypothetical protein
MVFPSFMYVSRGGRLFVIGAAAATDQEHTSEW